METYFPDDFILGAGSSAFQTEGAWNISQKGESIWDRMTHEKPHKVVDGSNADIATNFYNMYKTDISLIKQINGNAYRISISWSRVMPTGFSNNINTDGITFYNNVINEMLRQNITPFITIHHWDLPQKLQELGGWANPLIADWFVDYAKVLFTAFGDRVKYWITINEPSIMCHISYTGDYAPGIDQSGIGEYLCGHHVLLAHAKTYQLYDKEFRHLQNGQVGIGLFLTWHLPENPNDPEELSGVEFSWEFWNSWFLHPIFSKHGDYPHTMKHRISQLSHHQGFTRSRLPKFTKQQIAMIINSTDYLGINFYNSIILSKLTDHNFEKSVSFAADTGMNSIFKHPAKNRCTPLDMSKAIKHILQKYKNIPYIFITENGFEDHGELLDYNRANYYYHYLHQVLKLISEGVNIRGYFAWSLTDNYEWISGYSIRYGIFSVNFTDPQLPRSPKLSSRVISQIYKARTVTSSFTLSD
ncbi:myrosinase 1 isoform X2 [Microplitis demolitor]|nr:myrosinase 1 isoform X2 [Microplitis demolitor]